jgi:glyoxalase family protein
MTDAIRGLHHVTAICADPQANLDWHAGLLGRRLVKRTVNFDDPGTYHLYYGDRGGAPGGVLTFFPFMDAGPGRAGAGMASAVAYAVPKAGLDAWIDRLAERAVEFDGPETRFGERMVALRDVDGLRVELVEAADAAPDDGGGDAPPLAGFHSVTLALDLPDRTARLLEDLFGWRPAGVEADAALERRRFVAPAGGPGGVVDLVRARGAGAGRMGAGTIHHVAFRAADAPEQQAWRERALAYGLDVTPVIDRQYFQAIYFREPGGVLFEIATDPPGFAVDEPVETLGRALKLPERYEPRRADIERVLPPLRLRR